MIKNLVLFLKKKKTKMSSQEVSEKPNETMITFSRNGDVFKMSIGDGISLDLFFDKVGKLPEEEKETILKLPLGVLIDGYQRIKKGNYLWITIGSNKYIIVVSNEMILIKQSNQSSNSIEERSFYYDVITKNFSISKQIHNNYYSTIYHKKFDSNGYSKEDKFTLSLSDAQEELSIVGIGEIMHKVREYFNKFIKCEGNSNMKK